MTLLEITVVITVILSLIAVLFIGARAWKAGSDRSTCLVNIRNVQLAARSYQNMYAINLGAEFNNTMIIGANSFIPQAPSCPAEGAYTFATTFPATGTLFMTCNVEGHEPPGHGGW
ncbi:MAG: type II secretion system protein [Verrucomicrobiales bacterium]